MITLLFCLKYYWGGEGRPRGGRLGTWGLVGVGAERGGSRALVAAAGSVEGRERPG